LNRNKKNQLNVFSNCRSFRNHCLFNFRSFSEIENAYKLASPYQFFIVQKQDGAYHLDGDYTVFGEVIDGMDVVDKIATVETDDSEWPLKNVFIKSVEILK